MSEFWEGRRVLITGVTGLVGSCLARSLVDRGARVVAFVRDPDPQSEFLRGGTIHLTTVVLGSLEDYQSIERAINEHEVETVFHLGAQTIVGTANRSPLPTFEANIRGTYNLLEACRVHGSLVHRVIIASSDKAYGDCETLPYTESTPPLGRHPYDVSKSCTDLLARAYFHTYRTPVVVARCGNIYGPGDLNWSRIIPGTIRSLHQGQRPLIRSNGKFLRDYVYVADAAGAYMSMAEQADRDDVRGEAFNFGPGEPLGVLTIVDALRRVMGREDLEPIILDQAKSEIRDQYLCSAKAREVLGWEPSYRLESGLARTVEWYTKFLDGESGPRAASPRLRSSRPILGAVS